jgi:predicted porin
MEIYRMKKSLLAVAAMTAFAGAAQAQSSVTVYGLLDMGYLGGKTTTSSATGVKTATNYSQFGQNNLNTSRLGFKGTEDLGGGASAFFTVELGLAPQDANLSGSTAPQDSFNKSMTNGGGQVDNRQSFVGLKKNGIGQFAFGRQYTVIFQEAAKTDTSQLANIVGNVIYQGTTSAPSGTAGTGYGYGESFTNRTSNTLTVGSASFAGFQGNAFYALKNSTKTSDTAATNLTSGYGVTNYNGYGLNLNYTWNKLYATVAYQSIKTQLTNDYTSAATTTNVNDGGVLAPVVIAAATTTTIPAIMLADKQTYAAATYDFGILKAYAQWIGRKIQNDTTVAASSLYAGSQLNRTAQQIGVRSFVTPTIEAYASIGNGKITGPQLSTGQPASLSFVGYQLGSNYWLSKRTNLYAIYGQNQTGASTTVAGGGASANQYAVGVRHTF